MVEWRMIFTFPQTVFSRDVKSLMHVASISEDGYIRVMSALAEQYAVFKFCVPM